MPLKLSASCELGQARLFSSQKRSYSYTDSAVNTQGTGLLMLPMERKKGQEGLFMSKSTSRKKVKQEKHTIHAMYIGLHFYMRCYCTRWHVLARKKVIQSWGSCLSALRATAQCLNGLDRSGISIVGIPLTRMHSQECERETKESKAEQSRDSFAIISPVSLTSNHKRPRTKPLEALSSLRLHLLGNRC